MQHAACSMPGENPGSATDTVLQNSYNTNYSYSLGTYTQKLSIAQFTFVDFLCVNLTKDKETSACTGCLAYKFHLFILFRDKDKLRNMIQVFSDDDTRYKIPTLC